MQSVHEERMTMICAIKSVTAATVMFYMLGASIVATRAIGQVIKVDGTPTCFRALLNISKPCGSSQAGGSLDASASGAYAAVEMLGKGDIDIAVIEYPLRKYVDNAWAKAFPDGKTPPTEHIFAQTALGVVANRKKTLTRLTHAQLRDIWSGKAAFWRDVGGSGERIKVLTSKRLSSGLGGDEISSEKG